MFEMTISGSVKAISTEDDAISAAIIAPMSLYYEYFDNEDYYHMITYNIDAENGSYERVKKNLAILLLRTVLLLWITMRKTRKLEISL